MAVSTGTALLLSTLAAGGTAAYQANEQRKNAKAQRFAMAEAAGKAEREAAEQARGSALQQQSASAAERAGAAAELAAAQSASESSQKAEIQLTSSTDETRNRRAVRQRFGIDGAGAAGTSGSIRV